MDQEQNRQRRAVIYLRVTRAQGGSDDAVTAQRAACERIAARYGVTIVREYLDHGKPARFTQQTELQRLLADLEQLRDVAYIVVYDYARLGWDIQSLDDVIRRIQSCGAEVATITGVETVERLGCARLLDQVAEWARGPAESGQTATEHPEPPLNSHDLSAAVQAIRSGALDTEQREALATLVAIAGNATLPTPVAAAVFNTVEVCKRTAHTTETTNE